MALWAYVFNFQKQKLRYFRPDNLSQSSRQQPRLDQKNQLKEHLIGPLHNSRHRVITLLPMFHLCFLTLSQVYTIQKPFLSCIKHTFVGWFYGTNGLTALSHPFLSSAMRLELKKTNALILGGKPPEQGKI